MKDKWFSIIFAISMSILAGFSLLMRVESLANVAKAISFPMFLFKVVQCKALNLKGVSLKTKKNGCILIMRGRKIRMRILILSV